MTTTIYDRDTGKFDPVAQKPDAKAYAEKLKAGGMTYEEVRNMGNERVQARRDEFQGRTATSNGKPERASDPEAQTADEREGSPNEQNAFLAEVLNQFESLEVAESTPIEVADANVPVEEEVLTQTSQEAPTDLIQNSDYRETDLLQKVSLETFTVPQVKEQVFISEFLTGEKLPPEKIAIEVQNKVETGSSDYIDTTLNSLEQGAEDNLKDNLLKSLTEDPEENAKMLETFQEQKSLKAENPHNIALQNFYDILPKERVVPDNIFEFLNTQVRVLNSISAASSIIAQPLQDKKKLAKDFGEILVPMYGPSIYIAFQNALAEDNVDVAINLLFGNENIDKLQEKYWSLETGEQVDYVMDIVEGLSSVPTAAGTDNHILKIDLIARIYNKLSEGPATIDEFTLNDGLNVLDMTLSELAIAVPLIKIVKDTISMGRIRHMGFPIDIPESSVVKRLEDYTKPSKAKGSPLKGEFVARDDIIYENKHTGTALDIINDKNPSGFKDKVGFDDLRDVTDGMGVDPADMPRRILPRIDMGANTTPRASGINHRYLSDGLKRKVDSNHLALQLTKAEKEGLLPSFVKDLSRELGETIVPHLDKSYFDLLEDPKGTSLGDFVVRMGDGADSGFKTAPEARTALSRLYGENAKVVRRTPYNTFSDDLMEGVNGYGDYFIEVRQRQETSPLSASVTSNFLGGQGLVTGGGFKPILNFVVDDGLLFNSQISKSYSNIRDRANAFSVELANKAEDLVAIGNSGKLTDEFNFLALKLQEQGLEDMSLGALTEALGRIPDKKVVKALKSARDINLANWYVKNSAERAVLTTKRYKTTEIRGERYISKPLLQKPTEGSIKGKTIYDPESSTDIPLTQSIIDGLYEGGGVVAELYKNIKVGRAEEFTHIIVRNPAEQIRTLQPDVVPYVKGHVQRIYEDNGWLVLGTTKKKVNGENKIVTVPLGITQTKTEANMLASGLANRGHSILKKSPVQPTKEYLNARGIKHESSFSLEMSQERGERLKAMRGEEFGSAEVLDPFSSYIKVLHKTANKFEQPLQELNKNRWIQIYSKILKSQKFPTDVALKDKSLVFKDVANNRKAIQEAEIFHRKIRLQESGDLERATQWYNNLIKKAADAMDDKGFAKTSRALDKVDASSIQTALTGIGTIRWIWGQPIYQALSVVAQTPFMLALGPTAVAKSVGELVLEFIPLMVNRGEDGGNFVGAMAKLRGVPEERITKELQAIVDAGIIRTAEVGQDMQADINVFTKMLLEAKSTRGTTLALQKGFKLPVKLFKGTVVGSIDAYELLSFFIAKNRWLAKNKGKDWINSKAIEEINWEARNISLNQNDTQRLAYQNHDNPLKFTMALMSYVNRQFIRMYLDPLTLGAISKTLSPKGDKSTNVWGSKLGVAIGGAAIGYALYGESYTDPLDGDFDESQREYLRAIASGNYTHRMGKEAKEYFTAMGINKPSNFLVETYYVGLMSSSSNDTYEGNVNWNEKFSNFSYLKAMHGKVVNLFNGNALDSIFGLHYVAGAGIVNTTKHNAQMLLATLEMEDVDSKPADWWFATVESMSLIKLIDDGVAVRMAAGMGRRVTKSTLTPREKTTLYEQLAKIAGGIPLEDFYSIMNFDKSDIPRVSSDNYLNYMVRKSQMELYRAFEEKGENLTQQEASAITERNLKLLLSDEDFNTDKAVEEYNKKIMVVGKPIMYGEFEVTQDIQNKSVSIFKAAMVDKTPAEYKQALQDKLGVLELQIQAHPNNLSLKGEKKVMQNMLENFYMHVEGNEEDFIKDKATR